MILGLQNDAGRMGFNNGGAAQAPETGGGLTPETLANMEYANEFTQSGVAPLENGEYSEAAAPGSATQTKVMLTEHVAFGELSQPHVDLGQSNESERSLRIGSQPVIQLVQLRLIGSTF